MLSKGPKGLKCVDCFDLYTYAQVPEYRLILIQQYILISVRLNSKTNKLYGFKTSTVIGV